MGTGRGKPNLFLAAGSVMILVLMGLAVAGILVVMLYDTAGPFISIIVGAVVVVFVISKINQHRAGP
jgi:hypothetical protein